MNKNLKEKLKAQLLQLVGKRCWGIVAGDGSGSIISLCIGDKIKRKKPIENPTLTKDVQEYDSEYRLLLFCVWRLDSDKKIICGAWDDNSQGGKMLKGLNMLVGRKITQVNVCEPALDITISFSGYVRLKVFCDQINEIDKYENYTLSTPMEVFVVGNRSRLR